MTTAMRRAFSHIDEEYGGPAPAGGPFGGAGTVPGWGAPPVADRFKASRAYDKLISLVTLALASGVVGWFALKPAEAVGLILVAFVIVLVGWFRMRWARYLAPTYSVCEGLALGAVSKAYSTLGHGVVPAAILFTGGVFIGALVLYRTGLVRVTPRMMSLAFMGALGIMAVAFLSLLGLPVPGLDSLTGAGLVFSVLALGIAVLNLFTDFAFVTRSETMGVSADAEWAAAFAMMTALVLVYISMLRILGAAYGGGGRRR
jgi:uncharacterized YccA/Bax inhibitor family protein